MHDHAVFPGLKRVLDNEASLQDCRLAFAAARPVCWRIAGSVSCDDRTRVPTEVEAYSEHALAFANADVVVKCACRVEKCQRARSEVIVIVFGKRGCKVG